ncbi:MAG: hypothetical protein RL235_540 [Chlamydiota bacterium]|jgi:hypothetical protein
MDDQELLKLNAQGFIPGPNEPEGAFVARVRRCYQTAVELADDAIAEAHWEWPRTHLGKIFAFSPRCLPAYYSDRSLRPWEGAATWIGLNGALSIQLRKKLKKGSYLAIYDRGEILAHEAVHAARATFDCPKWEEFFAYMSAEKKWRRVLGPIVQRPWEVWPLMGCLVVGLVWPAAYLLASVWLSLGFIRLVFRHRVLTKAAARLGLPIEGARGFLFRLSDDEIEALAFGKSIGDASLRWRLLRLAYNIKEKPWLNSQS